MRARLSIVPVAAFVMVVASFQAPAAFAQEGEQQRDPNEGEPKHEINELQNKLHQTEDKSTENHIEGKIEALQDLRQDCEFPDQGVQLKRPVLITSTSPKLVEVTTDPCGNVIK